MLFRSDGRWSIGDELRQVGRVSQPVDSEFDELSASCREVAMFFDEGAVPSTTNADADHVEDSLEVQRKSEGELDGGRGL